MIHLKICLVCSSRLPANKYGGTERIVEWLILEFLKMGHTIVLVAPEGTHIQGVNCIPANNAEDALISIPKDVDIVHFHGWPPVHDFEIPWIYTLHGNTSDVSNLPINTVCISANHAERHQKKTFIYNGVNPDEFIYREHKKNYLLFFSMIRRKVKGASRALKIVQKYKEPAVFAGGSRIDLIKGGGLLNSFNPRIKFVGKIGGIKKAQYFADAKALLFPIDWEEPFGLVLIESLLSGTPVIATPRGSVPELINTDVGALFTDDETFPEALEKALSCSPKHCREWAIAHFSSAVCAANYLNLYDQILSGENVF